MDAAGSVFQVVDAHLLARTFRYGSFPRGQLLSPLIMPVVSVASYKKSVGSDCPRRLGWRALTRSILGIKIAACGMILRMKGVQHNTSLFSLSPYASSCPCPEWEMDIQADPSATRCSCGWLHGRGWSRAVATWHCKVKLSNAIPRWMGRGELRCVTLKVEGRLKAQG